jgi:hypothetical protein
VAALSGKVAEVKRGVQRASRELNAPFAVLEQRAEQLRRVAQVNLCCRSIAVPLRPRVCAALGEKEKVLRVVPELLGQTHSKQTLCLLRSIYTRLWPILFRRRAC